MVAIFLLLVCAAPMLHIYTYLFKEQQALLRTYQQDHWVHLIHAKITEQMYKRQIPFEDLLQGKSGIQVDGELKKELDPLGFGCTYTLKATKTPSKKKEEITRYLCELVIKMEDLWKKPTKETEAKDKKEEESPYIYFIYIQSNRIGSNDEEDLEETPPQDVLDGSD